MEEGKVKIESNDNRFYRLENPNEPGLFALSSLDSVAPFLYMIICYILLSPLSQKRVGIVFIK